MSDPNVPVILGRVTSWPAMRLYNAVISTGREALDAQRTAMLSYTVSSVKKLVDRLEWLADGPKLKWENVVRQARRAVRKFLDQFECADCAEAGFDHAKLVERERQAEGLCDALRAMCDEH